MEAVFTVCEAMTKTSEQKAVKRARYFQKQNETTNNIRFQRASRHNHFQLYDPLYNSDDDYNNWKSSDDGRKLPPTKYVSDILTNYSVTSGKNSNFIYLKMVYWYTIVLGMQWIVECYIYLLFKLLIHIQMSVILLHPFTRVPNLISTQIPNLICNTVPSPIKIRLLNLFHNMYLYFCHIMVLNQV